MLETARQFAKRRGVASATVSEWKNRGHLVLVGRLIDVEPTNARLDARPLRYRGGTASQPAGTASDPPPIPTHSASTDWSLVEAQRRKEVALAKRRELDYEVAAGKLIDKATVESCVRADYTTTATRILLLPSKLAPRLAALREPAAVEELLRKELTRAMNSIADEADAELQRLASH